MSSSADNSGAARDLPEHQEARQVLVVESDEEQRNQIESHLAERGFLITAVSSIALAEELCDKMSFDLVVANLTLRDGTSYELMSKMRGRSAMGLSISQYGDSFERFTSNKCGFSAHLKTPVDLESLVHKLRT